MSQWGRVSIECHWTSAMTLCRRNLSECLLHPDLQSTYSWLIFGRVSLYKIRGHYIYVSYKCECSVHPLLKAFLLSFTHSIKKINVILNNLDLWRRQQMPYLIQGNFVIGNWKKMNSLDVQSRDNQRETYLRGPIFTLTDKWVCLWPLTWKDRKEGRRWPRILLKVPYYAFYL